MQNTDKQWIVDLFSEQQTQLHRHLSSRLANVADVQELAQEAYLRMLRVSRKEFIKHPQAYLYRIATNLVYESYTNSLTASQWASEEELNKLEMAEPLPEQAVARSRQLQQIEQAMSELSPKCRAVVSMRSRQGMTNPEIAEQMGLSTEMVKKYMSKGVAHCRKRLRRFRDET